ncbi:MULTISPECIES: hypothetical protein [Xanthomonas]|uniref:Uncharacterized protein n=1 Tax=Xanthomonas cucurbitae TaxID=56453 RepID=A0ABY7Y7X4_9XANT|nr:hypothetical protein [Xanthomonas cucurbitae]WDM66080.1 hypothetical protein K6981_10835 [Xanthomonas cucurbitae]WDM69959.1 hypothetical protein K6978_10810 [Xanthomonas cucurbitae]WDM73824.1 hypothetical protein K6982_10055 [Xanthomonas cucurbitae]WDM80660.1 hypothetical protein K6980_08420 [Xanthomonas cucurbitae]WDM84353.1 hypothetical protein K6979_08425 [Xanthomonas cucurbitae]
MPCKFPGRPVARVRKPMATATVLDTARVTVRNVLGVYAQAALALLWLA